MIDDNLSETLENVNNNLEYEKQLKFIKDEVLKRFNEYQKTLTYMAADAPIQILNLPKKTENILLAAGYLRIYDILNLDFAKVKGLGDVRIRQITTGLDQFLSVL